MPPGLIRQPRSKKSMMATSEPLSVVQVRSQVVDDHRFLLASLRGRQPGGEAAVHYPVLTGDVAAIVAREERSDTRDVGGFARPAHRERLAEDFSQQAQCLLVLVSGQVQRL